MQIAETHEDGVTVFVLEGRVDSAGATLLGETLQAASAKGQHRVVLDMAGVSYINSAGLRTLADTLTASRAHQGDVFLVSLNPKVERVFKIIGFDRFFEIYDSVEAAVAEFGA